MKRKLLNLCFAIPLLLVGCKSGGKKFTADYTALFKGNWNMPGLHNKDGSEHVRPATVDLSRGLTINVADYGARANDPSFDSRTAFMSAIADAVPGDTVYVPEGTFYFKKYSTPNKGAVYTHINLPSGIGFVGAGTDKTILVSCFDVNDNIASETTLISVVNQNSILIKDLTVSSNTPDENLPDPDNQSVQNPNGLTAPKYGITVTTTTDIDTEDEQSHNVVIDNVVVEKFQRMGVRLAKTRDVTVKNSTFQKAVNLGSGGMGYGVNIQAQGAGLDFTDLLGDSKHNVVEDCHFKGDYIRHGVVVQYYSHNNLIQNNLFTDNLLDAIDMHGEMEYSNEIVGNTVNNTRKGAGIGLGNSGATHAGSGRNNYVHDNTITGGKHGVHMSLGTKYSIIVDNTISDVSDYGISCSETNYTYLLNNEINNVGKDGINIDYSFVMDNPAAGIPDNYFIQNNVIDGAINGIKVTVTGKNFVMSDNIFKNISGENIIDLTSTFILPEKVNLMEKVNGTSVKPIQNTYVSTEHVDKPGEQKNMKLKASTTEPNLNRLVFALFDIPQDLGTYQKVYISITAKAQNGCPTISMWANSTYTDWTDTTITWNNSKLHDESIGISKNTEEDPLIPFHNFTFPIKDYNMHTYYLEVTEAFKTIGTSKFTLLLSNDLLESDYMEVYNANQAGDQAFRLIFA